MLAPFKFCTQNKYLTHITLIQVLLSHFTDEHLGKVRLKILSKVTKSKTFTITQSSLLVQGADGGSPIPEWVQRGLTRKVAMATPVRKPASTSDQWLRYSATRTTPTRKAGHSRARQSEGLTKREPFTRNTSVTYICGNQTGPVRGHS